jgi:cytochrome c oxidase assembly factor CtaG
MHACASGSQLTARTRHAILSYPIPMCLASLARSRCRRRRRRRRWPLSRRPIRWRCAVAALMMNFESGTEHALGRVIEEKKP